MFRKAWQFLGSVVSGSAPDEDPVPSLILLLETPFDLTKESALQLAVQAWGESAEEPALVRSPRRGSYVIRVSNLLFGLRAERARYEAPRREPNAVRQRVWDHHRAWLGIEYPEGPKTPESQWPACYKLLFLLANQIWDDSCLGIYLPREGVTVPNMGDLISSIRWAGNNGTPLPFLHEASEREA
jgi:hypothetical protein